MNDTGPCPVCGTAESAVVFHGARYAPEATIRRCVGCGLAFYAPRPTPAELAAYYEGDYRKEYDGAVSPETTYRRAIGEARTRVERLRPLLAQETRLLEVGASCGAFLEAVRPFVGSVTGVEPGDEHRAWGRSRLGLDIVADISAVTDRRFDLIVLFHTLEHLLDPVAYIRDLRPRLARGGRMVIEVPNVDDALLRVYRVNAFPTFYYQRAHLYYFSPRTLALAIEAAGGRADITGVQRYDLSNHLQWLQTGTPGGQGAYNGVISATTCASYAADLIRAGTADTLWAVATF